MRPGIRERDAADTVHGLLSRELYRLLVVDRGCRPAQYEQWLTTPLADQLLPLKRRDRRIVARRSYP